jgi:hypothetical protein
VSSSTDDMALVMLAGVGVNHRSFFIYETATKGVGNRTATSYSLIQGKL